jgi:uncharacterized protein YndB with AHSA1/START domain
MTDDDDDSGEVRQEVFIDASPQTVFSLLTDQDRMRAWLADVVEAEPHPGGRFYITGPAEAAIEGTYLEVTPYTKVVFTWGGVEGLRPGQSVVEIELSAETDGTRVRLRHYRLPRSAVEPHRQGWATSGLVKLKAAAEGRPVAEACLSHLAAARRA